MVFIFNKQTELFTLNFLEDRNVSEFNEKKISLIGDEVTGLHHLKLTSLNSCSPCGRSIDDAALLTMVSYRDLITVNMCTECLDSLTLQEDLSVAKWSEVFKIIATWVDPKNIAAALDLKLDATRLFLTGVKAQQLNYHTVLKRLEELKAFNIVLFSAFEAKSLFLDFIKNLSFLTPLAKEKCLHKLAVEAIAGFKIDTVSYDAFWPESLQPFLLELFESFQTDFFKSFSVKEKFFVKSASDIEVFAKEQVDLYFSDKDLSTVNLNFLPEVSFFDAKNYSSLKSWLLVEYLHKIKYELVCKLIFWQDAFLSIAADCFEKNIAVVCKDFSYPFTRHPLDLCALFPEDAFIAMNGAVVFIVPKILAPTIRRYVDIDLGEVFKEDSREVLETATVLLNGLNAGSTLELARLALKSKENN